MKYTRGKTLQVNGDIFINTVDAKMYVYSNEASLIKSKPHNFACVI